MAREINVIIRARNSIANGLKGAQGSLMSFGKSIKTALSASLGPIAAVIGAFMLLKKIVGWVQEAFDAKNKAMRAHDEQQAKAAVDELAKSYTRLTSEIQKRTAATKDGQKVADMELKSMRELTDAQRELAKQKELAAIAPEDKEGRKAIEAKYEEIDAIEEARRKSADLRTEQQRLLNEAAAKRQAAIELGRAEIAQAQKALELAEQASKYNRQASSTRFQIFGGEGARKGAEESAKAAGDAAKAIRDQQRKTREDRQKALDEAAQADREAAAMTKAIQAAAVSETALTLEQRTAKAQEDADKRVEIEKQAAEKIKQANDDIADAEADMQKQLDAIHDAAQKKQLADELAANDKKMQAAQDLAKMKIAEFIAEARAKKDAAKEEERDAKKQARLEAQLAAGRGIGKGAAEWLAARQAIQNAGNQAPGLQAAGQAIKDAQQKLDQQAQLKAMHDTKDAIVAHNKKLDALLQWT
jgi:hypothetical protein